ncbi:ribonucleoside-diphosphate reductase, adenosylcobalamin-dependent [Hydrogenophaga sp. RAC07]|uniref:LAGLIDADG family homing endonuclease n=1 Tax=Hydrogenophaga sp. RAC07 TaxID=1842537 RepID=UPI00083E6B39|nr:LAGLIDADG family homing endonuclease [Hydrogenophaga sp. RAC07]AOF87275.1 ribonucleoside-diphosphate reductase, adenosylcobalamin-dependent [Hydrogenophaga sp. RAC07]
MKRDALKSASTAIGQQPITLDVLKEKYLKDGETSEQDIYRRVARALAWVEPEADRALWEQRFFDNLQAGAIGAGRIMSAAGTAIQATLINCFVQPVGDCIQGLDDGGYPGIYEALREAAETMRRGGGVGYDFSRIRPRGAEVKTMASLASGPCSYINVFDQSCATVESAGARRGAQMGVLRIDHPDVLEFITAKRTPGRWNNFNVSVGVSDAFMRALADDQPWELVHRARPGAALLAQGAHQRADGLWVYRSLPARELWDTVMRSTYDFAEPGILFLDHIQQDNNLRYCESIEATNPCVTADTRLATQHGLVRIGDLYNSGLPLETTVDRRALGREGRGVDIRPAKPAFMTAHLADVFKLTTEDGHEIKATAWHDFYTARGKLKLSDLKVGDELWVQSGKGQFGQQGSEELGLLLGLITGDGHFTHRGKGQEVVCINLWNQERELAERVTTTVNAMIASLSRTQRTYCVTPVAVAERNHVFIRSVLLARALEALGFTRDTKLRVPEVVWQGNEACVKAYLRALYQTDGTVNISSASESCSIRLSSSYPQLLKDVQVLLANFGVFSRVRLRREATVKAMPNGKGGQADYACKTQYELILDGESREQFMSEIGFLLDYKTARYREWVADKVLRKTQRFASRIAAIVPAGQEAVFDTTQADHNTVIFNGLVTGQCGEQPLPPYGCCDLGPVILPRFVRHPFGFGGLPSFDFEAFEAAVALQVRALDNVLDVTFWPLPQQREESAAKRRIGVGFTGMGNALAMLCVRYDRAEGRALAAQIAERMRDAAYTASVALAQEKGAFPKFDADGYLAEGTFASRLPKALQDAIRTHGIRNSHLLSIAPTGTVSLAFADNASNGIEPPFSWMYRRKKREADGTTTDYAVEDHAWRLYRELGGDMAQLPEYFVNALAMPATDHLAMMEAVQPFVDTAISKTVNVPADYPYDDFKGLYQQAWRAQLKGLATYRPNAILGSVLDTGPTPETTASVATVDPMRTVIESRPPGALPAVADKIEYWTQEGHQTLYLLVSFLPVPTADGAGTVERAIEFFMPVGQSGESQQWVSSSMRLLSLAARGGFLERALRDMRKVVWDRGPVRMGTHQKADGTHVPMWHDSVVAAIAYAVQTLIAQRAGVTPSSGQPSPVVVQATPGMMPGKKCGECGAHAVIRKDGCDYCTQCGHLGVCG